LAFLCFPPHWSRLVAGVRLGPYHRVLGVRFWPSCLISFLRVGGICLSHDEVKRAVGLFDGFVSAIASAPCSFLYLNNEYLIRKKKKKKRPHRPYQLYYLPPQKTPTCVPPLQRPNIWRLETYEGQLASKWVSRDPRELILITLHIRFQNCRRTNGLFRHSETSLAEGKVSKLHLSVFVTDANSSLPLRLPAAQAPTLEVRGSIRKRTLTHSAARRPAEE